MSDSDQTLSMNMLTLMLYKLDLLSHCLGVYSPPKPIVVKVTNQTYNAREKSHLSIFAEIADIAQRQTAVKTNTAISDFLWIFRGRFRFRIFLSKDITHNLITCFILSPNVVNIIA